MQAVRLPCRHRQRQVYQPLRERTPTTTVDTTRISFLAVVFPLGVNYPPCVPRSPLSPLQSVSAFGRTIVTAKSALFLWCFCKLFPPKAVPTKKLSAEKYFTDSTKNQRPQRHAHERFIDLYSLRVFCSLFPFFRSLPKGKKKL